MFPEKSLTIDCHLTLKRSSFLRLSNLNWSWFNYIFSSSKPRKNHVILNFVAVASSLCRRQNIYKTANCNTNEIIIIIITNRMFYIWFMAFLIYFELYSFILYVLRNVHDDNLRFELIEMTPIIIYSRERVRVIKSKHFFLYFRLSLH